MEIMQTGCQAFTAQARIVCSAPHERLPTHALIALWFSIMATESVQLQHSLTFIWMIAILSGQPD